MGDQRSENDTGSEASEAEAEVFDARSQPPAASRLDVTGTQVCASTLASVSAAVVASFFGVAGTIAGTAVVSVIATTGGAIYGHGIRKTGAKLQQTQAARLAHPLGGRQRLDATRDTDSSDADTDRAPAPGWKRWKEWLSQRRWGLAAGVAIVFVASLAAVTLIEVVGQQPLAGISGNDPSGNTSIGSLFDDGDQDTPDTTVTTDPSGSPTSSDSDAPSEAPEQPTTTSSPSTETTEPSTPTTEG